MSDFKEGWCRVLHEAAMHGTPILGSGLGGMKELMEIGGYFHSTSDTIKDDLKIYLQDTPVKNNITQKYRKFTLKRFNKNWLYHINVLLKL